MRGIGNRFSIAAKAAITGVILWSIGALLTVLGDKLGVDSDLTQNGIVILAICAYSILVVWWLRNQSS